MPTFLFDEDVDMTWFEEQIWPVLAARVPAFENLKVGDRKDNLQRKIPGVHPSSNPPTPPAQILSWVRTYVLNVFTSDPLFVHLLAPWKFVTSVGISLVSHLRQLP